MASRWHSLLLGAAGGAVMACCWLPLGVAPLLPLGLLLVMRGLRFVESTREAVIFGLVFAAARYAVAAHFLVSLMRYSALGGATFYAVAVVFALPFGVLECWGAYRLERRTGLHRSLGLALLYPLLEAVRTIGPLSFPADLLAHAFGAHPAWLAWSGWIGSIGVTLLAFAVAAMLDSAWERRARPTRAGLLAFSAAALWLGPPLSDLARPVAEPPAADSLRVGIVQPVVPVRDKLTRERWPVNWQRLERLTIQAARDADLVVWPETARPGALLWPEDTPFRDEPMEELANRAGVPILYGAEIARMRDGRVTALYNGAALARPGGAAGDWYGKQQLLPFAEGIPFADWIGWDPAERRRGGERSVLTLLGNFHRGTRPTIFEVGSARIGVLVCYEGMYPNLAARYRRDGANALLVITNDIWWGRGGFAPWHARMVATRARELDLPVIRAANSGLSSATDRHGRMVAASRMFDVTTLSVPLEPSPSPPTFFARHVWLVPGGISIALVSLVVAGPLARRLSGRDRRPVPVRAPGAARPAALHPWMAAVRDLIRKAGAPQPPRPVRRPGRRPGTSSIAPR